jgi:cytochrome c biogenesis protein CcmG, thiol:disulfide interchange protein DsbE
MTSRRFFVALAGLALVTLLAIGVSQRPHSSSGRAELPRLTAQQIQARLAGSPPALAALHAQANELLSGGTHALRARLGALHGQPMVINKWASWCAPCRSEFGAFQHASVDLGRKVAFIGIDSGDTNRFGALAFLRSFPTSYPSYYDPSGQLGGTITDSSFMPVTVFFDRHGREYIRQGPYSSLAALERDIEHYALNA